MKKVMIVLLVLALAMSLAIPAMADSFVPSIKQKEVGEITGASVTDANGKELGKLIVRPITSEDKDVPDLEGLRDMAVQVTSLNAALEDKNEFGVPDEHLEFIQKVYEALPKMDADPDGYNKIVAVYGLFPNEQLSDALKANPGAVISFDIDVPGMELDTPVKSTVMTSLTEGVGIDSKMVKDPKDSQNALLNVTLGDFGVLIIRSK